MTTPRIGETLRALVDSPLVVKAFHTFWQAFLAVWVTSGFAISKVAVVAAVAAGASAVKSLIVNTLKG